MSISVGNCIACGRTLIFEDVIEKGYSTQKCSNCNTKYKIVHKNYKIYNF